MKKERLVAFTDAVLAIIMTILVLELEKPASPTLSALWDLRYGFFSYALSFFWLGSMWVNIHNEWEAVERINTKILWANLVLLFFCSMIPYSTDFVSKNFNNKVTQSFYGCSVILVSLANICLSKFLEDEHNQEENDSTENFTTRKKLLWIDVLVKFLGLALSVTVFPPAMMYSVILSEIFLMIGIIQFYDASQN